MLPNNGNGIPKKWTQFKGCDKVIEETRIVCFKVPLKKTIQKNARVTNIWDVKTLLKTIPNLGAVIDLTNARYYDPIRLEKRGVLYKKITIPGYGIPPNNIVTEFQNTLHELLEHNKDSLVGVHSKLGLNRTAYMVCRYMQDRLNIPAPEAIKRFEVARGHKIRRQSYITHLLGRPAPPDLGRQAIV